MPVVQGFSHLAFSVTDSKKSAEFYRELFDGNVVDVSDAISPFHVCVAGDLMLGFRAHGGSGTFDHRNPGLDHVAFAVESAAELDAWRLRLDELGVKHSGIQEDPSGLHLNARDPDDIAIEFHTGPAS